MNLLASYIHNLDPVLLEVPGTAIAVRWYGLAYLMGFFLGFLLLRSLSSKKLYCVEKSKLGDFITLVCLFGVVCGGRLGEFFFYWLPNHGFSGFLDDPAWVFRVWEGGMASHGGILGVGLVALYYAKKHKLNAAAVLDGLAIAAPIGLFFGRVANFINGELYGRVCAEDSCVAVKFPQAIVELPAVDQASVFYSVYHKTGLEPRTFEELTQLCRDNEACRELVANAVPARYPSQLFEAFGEGLLILAILLLVRFRWKNAPAGLFAGLFGVLYAIARVVCECFKEPDDAVWMGVTKGQWLSFGIFGIGVALLIYAFMHKNESKLQKN